MNIDRVVFFILIGIVSIVFFSVLTLFYSEVKKKVMIYLYKLKTCFRKIRNRFLILYRLNKDIKKGTSSNSIEMIFSLFCHFYEHHFHDSDSWELSKHFFPEGKKELTSIYKWIIKTRPDNFKEMESLYFNNINNSYVYWNQEYQDIKFRLNKQSELVIVPIEDNYKEPTELDFKKKITKLQKYLYNLDTIKILWILERRKFFLI